MRSGLGGPDGVADVPAVLPEDEGLALHAEGDDEHLDVGVAEEAIQVAREREAVSFALHHPSFLIAAPSFPTSLPGEGRWVLPGARGIEVDAHLSGRIEAQGNVPELERTFPQAPADFFGHRVEDRVLELTGRKFVASFRIDSCQKSVQRSLQICFCNIALFSACVKEKYLKFA